MKNGREVAGTARPLWSRNESAMELLSSPLQGSLYLLCLFRAVPQKREGLGSSASALGSERGQVGWAL